MSLVPRSLKLLPLVLATFVATVGADVKVVNVSGPSPFTTIQSAVDAASDGDVVLVRAGTYNAGFTITDKALTVVGDGAVTIKNRVRVANLSITRSVVLAKLSIVPVVGSVSALTALHLYGNSGEVRVQECTIRGGPGQIDFGYTSDPGDHGVRVEDCAGGVALVRCAIEGGGGGCACYGGMANPYWDGREGGDGLYVSGARVALYDCTTLGGLGGHGGLIGGNGGFGARVLAGAGTTFLMASKTSFTGGQGGDADDWICFGACHHPGDGGDGLSIGAGTAAWTLDATFAGGGVGGSFGPPTPPSPGQALVAVGSHFEFAVSRVTLEVPSLARAGAPTTLTVRGDPGDQVFLLRGRRMPFLGIPSWRGVRLVAAAGSQIQERVPTPFVTIPASGSIAVTITAPLLEAGENEERVQYQAYRKTPSGQVTLGSYGVLTVVDPSF